MLWTGKDLPCVQHALSNKQVRFHSSVEQIDAEARCIYHIAVSCFKNQLLSANILPRQQLCNTLALLLPLHLNQLFFSFNKAS